MKFQQFD